ncbi:MAG: hypothetical protein V1789_08240 [PVC group bacterium]
MNSFTCRINRQGSLRVGATIVADELIHLPREAAGIYYSNKPGKAFYAPRSTEPPGRRAQLDVTLQEKGNRMRQFSIVLLSISAMLLTSGCSSVTTKHPLSNNPKPIDQEKFEGVWLVDDTVVHVQFGSNGIAQIAGLEWENNQFHIVQGEMIVTEGDKHNFLSVRFQEDGKWMDDYLFLAYKFSEQGDLILWLPNEDVFEEAIEKKQLDGVIKQQQYSTDITITTAPEKLLEFIIDPDNLKLFEYREPMILRKVAGDTKAGQRDQPDKK